MKHFRAGKLARADAAKHVRRFIPFQTLDSVGEVTPEALIAAGKKLVLIDADNTILPWGSEALDPNAEQWLKRIREGGLDVCLISNTRNRERLERISKRLGIPFAEGRFKPRRDMYVQALERFGAQPEEAVMFGDQIFTDVWGANRAGIESILVRPLTDHEFIGTKFSRILEKIVWRSMHKILEGDLDDLPIVEPTGFFQRRIVRQFAKFCIVGLTSFAIDYNVRMTLQFAIRIEDQLMSDRAGAWLLQNFSAIFGFAKNPGEAFWPVACTIAAMLAILNSFIWNRMWTFNIRGREEAASQLGKFYFVSAVGLILNVLLSTSIKGALPLQPKDAARAATVIAAGIVAFWNFFGMRLYAFRSRKSRGTA